MKCLFLLCLCLLPFVVFSSTFSSQNSIELPSENVFPDPVLDLNGKQVVSTSSYRIISTFWGALGGDVYLGESPNSDAPCPNAIFRYNSDVGPSGTPVRFIPYSSQYGSVIVEDEEINIQFDISPENLSCVNYTIWKVGEYDASLDATLLETGGTINQEERGWFKIVKASRFGYNLLYCPVTPIICLVCPPDWNCAKVGVVIQNGKRRLALVKDNPFDVLFQEVLV